MDSWKLDWAPTNPKDHKSIPTDLDKSNTSFSHEVNSMDSPCLSKDDSIESATGEPTEKNDSNILKPTFKSMLQAKKRLQAFSASKQLRRNLSKDEKTDDLDKSDKMSLKKSKKALYPLDKAQAVVQEIEEIKQKEAIEAQEEQRKIDAIVAEAYKNLALKEVKGRSRSPSIDRGNKFKKREIKSRNYRRSDSFKRRSASPENYTKRTSKQNYPINWSEYKQQGLTFVKDEELRARIFPKTKYSIHELVTKLLTFDGPSLLIETFKSVSLDEKLENVPMSFLRITRSKPTLTFSINNRKNRDSFVTRKQLYHVISRDRRSLIEKLISSASSRSQGQSTTLTSRPWYSKSWKKSVDAECKILENSVGLSFLQTYSDEDEDNEVEDNTNTNVNEASIREQDAKEIELSITKKGKTERETLTPENTLEQVQRKEKKELEETVKYQEEKILEQSKDHQRDRESEETKKHKKEENRVEEVKKRGKNEINETRKAIKELEQELERRKAIRIEEEEKEAKKEKKKKKLKKKETSSESEEEDKSKKKKKKKRIKQKKSSEDDDESSSDTEKHKKVKKKSKRKKEKDKKKKKRKAKKIEPPVREPSPKKKDENEGGSDADQRSGSEEVNKNKKLNEKTKQVMIGEDTKGFELNKAKDEEMNDYRRSVTPIKLMESEEGECKSESPLKVDKHSQFSFSRKNEEQWGKLENNIGEFHAGDKEDKNLKKLRHDSEGTMKSGDDLDRIKEFDIFTGDRRSNANSKDKYKFKEDLHKSEIDPERKYEKQLTNKNSFKKKRDSSRDHSQDLDLDELKDRKHRPESIPIKSEPDWEYLRRKRNKHRLSDYKELKEDFTEFTGFPLEADLLSPKESRVSKESSKREVGTPDTEEYRENWEKDSLPIWESEDEGPLKAREKLNSSWESDEEIFERGQRPVKEMPRPIQDTFDLEIPLNIKPFKRREIVDPDVELQLLKEQNVSLNEERRRLEIEKIRVRELEWKVIKEAEEKTKLKRGRSRDRETYEEDSPIKIPRNSMERDVTTPKRGRWDKKMSTPKVPESKLDIVDVSLIKKELAQDEDSSTNVSSTTSVNTSTVLENEYEEFMKALTSSPKKPQGKNKHGEGVENSAHISVVCNTTKKSDTNISITAQPDTALSVPPSPSQTVTILPKDIALIPMPLPKTEIKPVPVPSPQIEIDKIPKPLSNLSLSASITLDIAPKITAPPISPSNNQQAVITQSMPVESASEKNLAETNTDSVIANSNVTEDRGSTGKPFVFTTMVLPSKRQLLHNSKLNLGDSDDEEKRAKPLKKLEEIMNDTADEGEEPVLDKEKVDLEEKKVEKPKAVEKDVKKVEKETVRQRRSQDKDTRRKRTPDRHSRKDVSPRRSFHGGASKKEPSPRRRRSRSPPRRRGHSPKRHSPRRRSPPKRRSPLKRRHSPRRSPSPKNRRRSSISPRRKSPPKRSPSPKFRASSPKKIKAKSPDRPPYKSLTEKTLSGSNKSKSPTAVTSPMEGLKRSVADSTISDDLLPQPSINIDEYTQSPITQFYDRSSKALDSPKRESLDVRINQALGLVKDEPQPIPTTYSNYNYSSFPQQFNKPVVPVQQSFNKIQQSKSSFVQVGNMVQILPTEDIPMIQMEKTVPVAPPPTHRPVAKVEKSQIVQVGNMLQIVPTDLPPPPPPEPPLPPEPKLEPQEPFQTVTPLVTVQEKQSAETSMRLKVAERREEREKRRLERERRRKEKEKRRKEKEKLKQIKLKQRTENMIKRALELEAEGLEEEPEPLLNDGLVKWPPLSLTACSTPSKEVGKSILVRAGVKSDTVRVDRRKVVQFADGVRPGEGTSPSGGEELSSPPPRKKLPKEKRYKKTKLQKRNQKKKVKVKIIKKHHETDESDEDDNLPPPSPPPGSPPPHIFPPRVKAQPQPPINSVQSYLPNVVPIQGALNQQQLYRPPQLNLIMHPHHPPHGPPHPPHHHPGPPHPPHHHHHGPPPPPGPHFHHGPPPPPPHHHHGPPPPPGVGRPRVLPFPLLPIPLGRPRPHHHHHGPPPPFHH